MGIESKPYNKRQGKIEMKSAITLIYIKKNEQREIGKKVLQARYICASLHFLKLKLRDQLLLIFL